MKYRQISDCLLRDTDEFKRRDSRRNVWVSCKGMKGYITLDDIAEYRRPIRPKKGKGEA